MATATTLYEDPNPQLTATEAEAEADRQLTKAVRAYRQMKRTCETVPAISPEGAEAAAAAQKYEDKAVALLAIRRMLAYVIYS